MPIKFATCDDLGITRTWQKCYSCVYYGKAICETSPCGEGIYINTDMGLINTAEKETKQGPSKHYAMDHGGLTDAGEIALSMVENEIDLAEMKHPGWPTDIVHAVAIMMEEAGEAMQAALDVYYKDGDKEQLKKELAQTGAMAMRCLLHLV
jgi:hypothetical protein